MNHPGMLLLVAASWGCSATKPQAPDGTDSAHDSADPRGVGVDLAHPEDWAALPEAEDPLSAHQPDRIDCAPEGWHPEEGVLEIETNLCNYASLVAPSRVAMAAGEDLSVLVFHSALSALEPAEAHIALLASDTVLWERTVPIPSASEIYHDTVALPVDISVGTPIVLHLHNHGGNAWKLGHLRR